MSVVNYGYKVKRSNRGSYFVVVNNSYKYEVSKGAMSGTWYVTEFAINHNVAVASTMRDAVIKSLQLLEVL
jgi:hypothetical protein